MKKRAQFPDAFTYSIILTGLSENASHPRAVSKAVSIFQSMTGPTSRVRPGIVHTNSALRVCARKGDLDAMWSIASTIPENGPQAANATTYTTILNALRFNGETQTALRSSAQVVAARDEMVLQARQIWEDIAGKWYHGNIIVDESLVCAMGRVLLLGTRPQDYDDIYSLVEQTTNIWRQAPTLRSGAKTDSEGHLLPPPVGHLVRAPVGDEGPDAGGEFDPVPQSLSLKRATLRESKSASLKYVRPSNNTLSVLLEASQKLMLKRTADKYWEIFTDPEGLAVQPDEDNFHHYLRILRQSRGSSQAVKVVRDQMTKCEPMTKTYRIAMSTCLRNEKSPGVMKDASALMDLMQARLPQMDVKTCIMWMELAMRSPHGSDVYAAIERLGPQNIDLMKIATTGDSEAREGVVKLLKAMVSGADRLNNEKILQPEQKPEFAQRTRKWDALVSKLTGNDGWQYKLPEEEVRALRKEKKVDRFARKKEMVQARMRKLGTTDSKKLPPRPKKGAEGKVVDDSFSAFEHELAFK
jgi:hypothetical protein